MNDTMTTTQPAITKLDVGLLASGTTTGGGAMLWLSDYASAIGAIVAICSLCITAMFLFLNWRATLKGQEINRLNIEDRIMRDLKGRATEEQKKVLEDLIGD